jgi:hypothetical protein
VRRSLGLALLCAAAPALAAPRRVAVLDLVADGVAPDVRAQFETTIEEELRKGGAIVMPNGSVLDLVKKRVDLPDGCTFGPCVAGIGKALDVDRLLDVRITADGASYSYVLSLLDARGGAPVTQIVTTCGVCTVAEALGKMAGTVKMLEGQAPAVLGRDEGLAPMAPPRRSKVFPTFLVVAGLALAAGGTALVAGTAQDEAGFATIGAGGTAFLTGLFLLLSGD